MAIKFQFSYQWSIRINPSSTRPSALHGKTAHLVFAVTVGWDLLMEKKLRNAPKRACPSPPDLDTKTSDVKISISIFSRSDWNLRDFSKFLTMRSMYLHVCSATPGCIQYRHLGRGSSLKTWLTLIDRLAMLPTSTALGSPTAECRLHTIHSAKETQRTTSL